MQRTGEQARDMSVPSEKRRFDTVSGYRGVIQIGSKYRVQIGPKGVKRSVGTYSSAREAARAYDKAAIEFFGHGAIVNFPEDLPRHHSVPVGEIMSGHSRLSPAAGLSFYSEHLRQARRTSARGSRMAAQMHVSVSAASGHQSARENPCPTPEKISTQSATSCSRNTRVLRSGEAAYFIPDPVPPDQRPFATATGYRGVVRKRGKFQAQIGSRKTREYLGTYTTAEEAACVYDREAIKRFGNRAAVNFRFCYED